MIREFVYKNDLKMYFTLRLIYLLLWFIFYYDYKQNEKKYPHLQYNVVLLCYMC